MMILIMKVSHAIVRSHLHQDCYIRSLIILGFGLRRRVGIGKLGGNLER